MNTYGTLPNTGLAISLLGYQIGGAELVLVAAGLVATGAGLIRFSWRRDQSVSDR